MPKRKSSQAGEPAAEQAGRRSLRLQKPENGTASTAAETAANRDKPKPRSNNKRRVSWHEEETGEVIPQKESKLGSEPPSKKSRPSKQAATKKEPTPVGKKSKNSGDERKANDNAAAPTSGGERNYWLMKAEPESRLENGVDVSFSIDDLAAKTEPEPWDGIRAYAARNNLRAMKKGDLAFFYHSNCKEPGIVGTMEIVQEHSPDVSAHDPKAPYYDPNSKPSDPRWSVVHVKFGSKFAVPVGLKELRDMGGPGKPLENMQMLKQSRLSVSKVSAAEWEYLMTVAKEKASKA